MLNPEYFYVKDNILLIIQLTQPDYVISYSNELARQILKLPDSTEVLYLKDYINHYLYRVLQITCNTSLKDFPNYQFMHCFRLPHKSISLFINMYYFTIKQADYISIYGIPMDTHPLPFVNHCMVETNRPLYTNAFDGVFTLKLTSNSNLTLLNYNSMFLTYFNLDATTQWNGKIIDSIFPPDINDFFYSAIEIVLRQKRILYKTLNFHSILPNCSNMNEAFLQTKQLIVSFFPLNHPDIQGTFCRIHDAPIQDTITSHSTDLLEEYAHLFHLTSDAIALYNCSNHFLPVLDKINDKMKQLLKHFAIKQEPFLIGKELWTLMFEYKKEVHQTISLSKNHMVHQFNLCMIPIIRNDKITKVMLILSELNDFSQMNHQKKLTNREEEIISHVLKGEKNEYIAKVLNISTGTVKRTLSNAYRKLGINSRIELFYYYHQQHIIE